MILIIGLWHGIVTQFGTFATLGDVHVARGLSQAPNNGLLQLEGKLADDLSHYDV